MTCSKHYPRANAPWDLPGGRAAQTQPKATDSSGQDEAASKGADDRVTLRGLRVTEAQFVSPCNAEPPFFEIRMTTAIGALSTFVTRNGDLYRRALSLGAEQDRVAVSYHLESGVDWRGRVKVLDELRADEGSAREAAGPGPRAKTSQ